MIYQFVVWAEARIRSKVSKFLYV